MTPVTIDFALPDPRASAARRITTRRSALRAFVGDGSPWVIAGATALAAGARRQAGRVGRGDVAAVAAVVVAEPFVEWLLHTRVLHARPVTVAGQVIDLGAGHRAHHREPDRVEQVLVGGRYAVADSAAIAVGIHALGALATAVLGGNRRAVTRSALVAGYGALMTYEWTHLLMHTAYRPRSRWFRGLRTNHRLHHYRNERQWFGITSNLGDRLLGTLPASSTEVPLSPTARSL